jgi:hypothetical protein
MRSPEEKEGIFNDILDEITEGRALTNILKDPGMFSPNIFFKYLVDNPDKQKLYARACEVRHELLFDRMLNIAETPEEGDETTLDHNGIKIVTKDMLGHRRLKIDTIKWQLGKLNPKKFGDKLDLTSESKITFAAENLTEEEQATLFELSLKLKQNDK